MNANFKINQNFQQMSYPQYNQMNLVTQSQTLFVTGFPTSISDNFLIRLLETCGVIKSWKRMQDKDNNFINKGFCEYLSPEGTLKSLRLLDGILIDEGYNLVLKIDKDTKEQLKFWREQKKKEWIEARRIAGIPVSIHEVEEKEEKGEPLEWEIQLLNKDFETKEKIESTIKQRREIELLSNSDPIPNNKKIEFAQKPTFNIKETQRMKDRRQKKQRLIQKYEEKYRDELKRLEKKEEERENYLENIEKYESTLLKRKSKLYEKDLDYDSNNEENNEKYSKRRNKIRETENNKDRILRAKIFPNKIYRYDSTISKETGLLLKDESKSKLQLNNLDSNSYNDDYSNHEDIIIEEIKDTTEVQNKTENTLKISLNKKADYTIKSTIEDDHSLINNVHNINTIDEISDLKPNSDLKNRLEVEKKIKDKILNIDYLSFQKEIYWNVPQSKDEILLYKLDWDFINESKIIDKLKPWINKKLTQLLGEESIEYCDYVISLIESHKGNWNELQSNISYQLDLESEGFILLLSKSIIFEYIKNKKIRELI